MSRMYGIHFRAAIEGGLDQGRWVGQYLNALRTRRQPVRRLSWGLALAALNLAGIVRIRPAQETVADPSAIAIPNLSM